MPTEVMVRDARGGNWAWFHNAVIDDYGARLGPYGIAVYVCLCRHAGREQETWAGQSVIAGEIGCSVRQVRAELAKLETLGLVAVAVQKDGRGRLPNRYELLMPPATEPPATDSADAPPVEDRMGGTTCPNPMQVVPVPHAPPAWDAMQVVHDPHAGGAGAIMINKTQLTRPKEQEGAAGGVNPTAGAIAPAAPTAAPGPPGEESIGATGETSTEGDRAGDQSGLHAAGSRSAPDDAPFLATLGAPSTPPNRRAMAAAVGAFPTLEHGLEAAACAAYYADRGRSPPTLAQYADWCKRVREYGAGEERTHGRDGRAAGAATGAGEAGDERPGGDRPDPRYGRAAGGVAPAPPGQSANRRGWRESRERIRGANPQLVGGDLPDLPAGDAERAAALPDLPR